MSNHVFVSHSHEDSSAADLIVRALEERGVPCWVAPRDIPPGGSYAEALLDAIESASCFVLIYSTHSNVSSHVLREVERALKFGINIVPVRFDDSAPSKSLDYLLATVHWLSVGSDSRDRAIVKAAEQIAACLPKLREIPSSAMPARVPLPPAPASPIASPPRRNFLRIGAAILLALAAGTIGYLLSRDRSPAENNQKHDVAPSAMATPAATPIPPITAPAIGPVESTPMVSMAPPASAPPVKIASPPARQIVHGLVQDPDGIANVRQQPSLQGKIVGVVKDGDRVEIDGMQGDWVRIILGPDKSGYIHKSRVKIVSEK